MLLRITMDIYQTYFELEFKKSKGYQPSKKEIQTLEQNIQKEIDTLEKLKQDTKKLYK